METGWALSACLVRLSPEPLYSRRNDFGALELPTDRTLGTYRESRWGWRVGLEDPKPVLGVGHGLLAKGGDRGMEASRGPFSPLPSKDVSLLLM